MTGERLGNIFKWLTTTQVAKRLGVSVDTIRRMLDGQTFPRAYRTEGGQWRIPDADVIEYLGVRRRDRTQVT